MNKKNLYSKSQVQPNEFSDKQNETSAAIMLAILTFVFLIMFVSQGWTFNEC